MPVAVLVLDDRVERTSRRRAAHGDDRQLALERDERLEQAGHAADRAPRILGEQRVVDHRLPLAVVAEPARLQHGGRADALDRVARAVGRVDRRVRPARRARSTRTAPSRRADPAPLRARPAVAAPAATSRRSVAASTGTFSNSYVTTSTPCGELAERRPVVVGGLDRRARHERRGRPRRRVEGDAARSRDRVRPARACGPSCPPPMTPTRVVAEPLTRPGSGCSSTDAVCSSRKRSSAPAPFVVASAIDGRGEERGVDRARAPDRERADGHPGRHLDDREQRVETLQRLRLDRHARAPASASSRPPCPADARRRPRPRRSPGAPDRRRSRRTRTADRACGARSRRASRAPRRACSRVSAACRIVSQSLRDPMITPTLRLGHRGRSLGHGVRAGTSTHRMASSLSPFDVRDCPRPRAGRPSPAGPRNDEHEESPRCDGS